MPVRTNYRVPTRGRSVKIVGLNGEPLVLAKLARKHGKLKIVTKKLQYVEQLDAALHLLDINFDILEAHQAYKRNSDNPKPIYPVYEIPCRDRTDFQAGNWSRFSFIWMIYLSMSNYIYVVICNYVFRCT